MIPRDWSAANAAALVLLLSCAAIVGAVAQREVSAGPPGPAPAAAPARSPAAAAAAPRAAGARDAAALDRLVLETVARNPFRAERSRGAGRFRLPGSEAPAGPPGAATAPAAVQLPPPPPPRLPTPQFRLVGTAVLGGGGGLAAIEVPGAPPRVVNVGESISGFRLESVTPVEARLRGADTTLVIRSSSPTP
ncbi:MAG: hypothetical protein ABW277_15635 [Longimicrobiaceae bacterium]